LLDTGCECALDLPYSRKAVAVNTKSSRYAGGSALAVLALFACLNPGAARGANDKRVLVAVYEAAANRQTFALESGQSFQIQAGASVRLELVDPAWDNAQQTHRARVPGRFTTDAPAVIKLTGEDVAAGSVWAKAVGVPRNGQRVRIAYEPQGAGRQRGEILVEVVAAAEAAATAPAPVSTDRAQAVVAALYRGILLRDPDPGAKIWAETIRSRGYFGALSVAHDIAESRESKIEIYNRGDVSNQTRLVAMYRSLLGLDASHVDGGQWQNYIARLNAGDVAGVVDELARTPEFLQTQGFSAR
jgi:hypothetical protein